MYVCKGLYCIAIILIAASLPIDTAVVTLMSVVPPVEENVDSGITGSENIFPPYVTHR